MLAALNFADAGFSGIQLHGVHGYLISQFLSPLTNQRTDEWGGNAVRRRRFLIELVRRIRAKLPARVPLSVKLNSADFQRGGFTKDESLEVVRELGEAGLDLLEISGGTYEKAAMMGVTREISARREAYFLEYAAKARKVSDAALMVTGGFATVGGMNEALRSGALDVIGLGRPMIVDPELPRRLLGGEDVRAERLCPNQDRDPAGRQPAGDPTAHPANAPRRRGEAGRHAPRRLAVAGHRGRQRPVQRLPPVTVLRACF